MRRKLGCLESFHKATSFLITYFLSQSLITPLEKPIYWESCDRVTLIVYETPIDLLFMSRGKHSVDFCSDFPSVGNKGSQTVFFVVQLHSHILLFATPWSVACQASLSHTISWSLPKFMFIALASTLFFCPQSFPASGTFPMTQLFSSDDQNTGASASAWVLPVNIQGWSPCSPRDTQESSPAPQPKSINSSVLSLLYGPTLTSIHD